jgi:DNA-binding response OmpR family regulator
MDGGVAGARPSVIYIEDDPLNVRLVQRIFAKRDDFDLLIAITGESGVALARQREAALILLDLHLPDLDGETVLQLLRAHPATATVPVVVVTIDDLRRKQLLEAGAAAYLLKPVDVRRLVDTVDEYVEAAA